MFNLEKELITNGYSKINLEKLKTGHLKCLGSINGINANFILDTASGATIVEIESKEQFKLESYDSNKDATGAGSNNIKMEHSKNNTINLDGMEIDNIDLSLITLSHVNTAFEKLDIQKIDALIGTDLLSKCNAIIDYSNLLLYLKV